MKRWEAEEKLRTFDAFEWYPKALKVCTSVVFIVSLVFILTTVESLYIHSAFCNSKIKRVLSQD
jgi:hypothetical protein